MDSSSSKLHNSSPMPIFLIKRTQNMKNCQRGTIKKRTKQKNGKFFSYEVLNLFCMQFFFRNEFQHVTDIYSHFKVIGNFRLHFLIKSLKAHKHPEYSKWERRARKFDFGAPALQYVHTNHLPNESRNFLRSERSLIASTTSPLI